MGARRHGHMKHAIGSSICWLVALGCAGGDARAPLAAVRDSAGVRVVESTAPPPDSAPVRLNGPLFRVGWGTDEPKFQFVRTGAILGGGRIAVGDGSTVHLLAADGALERSVGRSGDGPGEFRSIATIVATAADSLIVHDPFPGRLSIFSGAGEFDRSVPLPVGRTVTNTPIVSLPGGRILFAPFMWGFARDQAEGWMSASVYALQPETGAVDTVATRDFIRLYVLNGRPDTGFPPSMASIAATGDGWVYALNDRAELSWFDADGTLVQTARWGEEPPVLTPEERVALIDEQMRFMGESPELRGRNLEPFRERFERGLDAKENRLPIFQYLHADPAGEVWMSEFPLSAREPTRYRVFASDGTPLGWASVPPRFTILDLRDGLVLGVERNELDVQAVSVYRIERHDAGR
jgi:hypothetical protein